jgi:hypothetical protein
MSRVFGLAFFAALGIAYAAAIPRPWLWLATGVTVAAVLLWPVRDRDAL